MEKKYTYKTSFFASFLSSLIILTFILASGNYGNWKAYLFMPLFWIVPVVFTASRSLIVTDEYIRYKSFWGLISRTAAWTEIIEFSKIRPVKLTTNMDLARPLENIYNWMSNNISNAALKLIVPDEYAFIIETGRIKKGYEIYEYVRERVQEVK